MPIERNEEGNVVRTPEDGRASFNLQDLRRATHSHIPHSTAVAARFKVEDDRLSIPVGATVLLTIKSTEVESHEDGSFTLWLNLEEQ